MEKLKLVLQRQESDKADGLHPFIDQQGDKFIDDKLKKMLKLNIDSKKGVAQKGGEEEEQAEEKDEEEEGEGAAAKTFTEQVVGSIENEEDREMF